MASDLEPASIVAEINAQLHADYVIERKLAGGEQNGAYLIRRGAQRLVLKWQSDPKKATQMLTAGAAVNHAADLDWPVARWLSAGG